jgi:hypothetical protein
MIYASGSMPGRRMYAKYPKDAPEEAELLRILL